MRTDALAELELEQAKAVLEGLAGFGVGDNVWWTNRMLPDSHPQKAVVTARDDLDLSWAGYEFILRLGSDTVIPAYRDELRHRHED